MVELVPSMGLHHLHELRNVGRLRQRNAELKSQKEASDAKDRMLEAGAAGPSPPSIAPLERMIASQPAPKPRDRDALGSTACATAPSRPCTVCPPVVAYDRAFQTRLADEIQRPPPGAALERAMLDYARLRDQARVCAARPRELFK